jgi:hypothetical protein
MLGICLIVGFPLGIEGTGDANRAIDAARGAEPWKVDRPLGALDPES